MSELPDSITFLIDLCDDPIWRRVARRALFMPESVVVNPSPIRTIMAQDVPEFMAAISGADSGRYPASSHVRRATGDSVA